MRVGGATCAAAAGHGNEGAGPSAGDVTPVWQTPWEAHPPNPQHNIYTEDDEDEEGELTPLARRFKIKTVPQFAFLKSNGTELVESFATRDRARLMQAVDKHKPAAAGRWEADEA